MFCTWVAGTYFDNSAVLELSETSLAFNSHKVISPSAGGGGKTDNEDIWLANEYSFGPSTNLCSWKMAGRSYFTARRFKRTGETGNRENANPREALRNFWVGMCRWDTRTLSLYQSKLSRILLPYAKVNSSNHSYPRVAVFQKLIIDS